MSADAPRSDPIRGTAASASADQEQWRRLRSLVHEMRSVLTAAKIGAEMLVGPRADDREYRRSYAEMIAEQTGRVARLLEDFSELSRPAGERLGRNGEGADVNVALDAAGRELAGLAAQLGQEMVLVPCANPALVAGDQGRVTQALRALLESLLVSAPPGSTVEARVSLPTSQSEAVVVAFRCQAPADGATSPVVLDWTRIGPAAARHIVETQGGAVTVPEDPEGLRLTVLLPREHEVVAGVSWAPPVEEEEGVYALPVRAVA